MAASPVHPRQAPPAGGGGSSERARLLVAAAAADSPGLHTRGGDGSRGPRLRRQPLPLPHAGRAFALAATPGVAPLSAMC